MLAFGFADSREGADVDVVVLTVPGTWFRVQGVEFRFGVEG